MEADVELRLVDPTRNRFRIYGLTVCRTLFGELGLRIVWGRIGNRRLRERTETFASVEALDVRRSELLARRARHGYARVPSMHDFRSAEYDIVEAHGLPTCDPVVRSIVARWHSVTLELLQHVHSRGGKTLDLVDVSTLAAMYVDAVA